MRLIDGGGLIVTLSVSDALHLYLRLPTRSTVLFVGVVAVGGL